MSAEDKKEITTKTMTKKTDGRANIKNWVKKQNTNWVKQNLKESQKTYHTKFDS